MSQRPLLDNTNHSKEQQSSMPPAELEPTVLQGSGRRATPETATMCLVSPLCRPPVSQSVNQSVSCPIVSVSYNLILFKRHCDEFYDVVASSDYIASVVGWLTYGDCQGL
jgi:hypothetical protein